MLEGACLLKASPCVARLLNLCQLERWETAFQCHLICIKTSHIYFPRTHGGSFPTAPIDWIRVYLSKWCGICVPHHAKGPKGSPHTHPQDFWMLLSLLWAPPSPHQRRRNCFLYTKKTLREEDDLASEKCWSLDLHNSEGQSWLRNDRARAMGCEDRVGLLLEEAGLGGAGQPVSQDDWSRLLLTSQP